MAKSLRSKSKLAARNARRHDPKSDYAVVAAARAAQIAERLHGGGGTQFQDQEDGDGDNLEQGDEGAEAQEEEKMEVEGETKKKISTSGTRQNRRETWRAAKGWKPKKSQGAGFFGGASKNGGKCKRRR